MGNKNYERRYALMFTVGVLLFVGAGVYRMIDGEKDRTLIIRPEHLMTSEVSAAENETSTASSSKSVHTSSKVTSAIVTVTTDTAEPLYIDINRASAEEFMKLYGIGEKLANAIIEYRQEHGEFLNIEEIMSVDGIGEKIFESIRPYIYVASPVYHTEPPETESPPEEIPEETEPPLTLEDIAPIDLNQATVEELLLLPHVNEEIAEKIIIVREQIGGYNHVYELLVCEMLTDAQVLDILPYVCVIKDEAQ